MTGFDTNVLIYSCDHSDKQRQGRALDLLSSTRDGVLLWQVGVEFVAASRKLAVQGFTPSQAWAKLREFMEVLPLIAIAWDPGVRASYAPGPDLGILGCRDHRSLH